MATTSTRTWEPVARGPVTWTWESSRGGGHVLKVYASVIQGKRHWGWQVLTFQGYLVATATAEGPDEAKADAEAALAGPLP